MSLPEAFIEDLKPYLPAEELEEFVRALSQTDASVCVRINRNKGGDEIHWTQNDESNGESQNGETIAESQIPWSIEGKYLSERPLFTLDPQLHGGAYYVQEASSQFVTHVLRTLLPADQPVTMLDLCAAPGGKSTAALSVLPEGSVLVSNEIDHRRARILSENVTKWGNANVIVTGNAPRDFSPLSHLFDVVLTDVPCSGEGMFRKDEGAISDWSPAKVEGCVKLQREILQDIWPTLKPGGLLIYGTCTFNVHEDEEQLRFICDELGATPVEIPVEGAWHIHPALKDTLPCYRFMPHYTRGEGLFMAALRKNEDEPLQTIRNIEARHNKKGGKPENNSKARSFDNKGKGGNVKLQKPAIDMKRLSAELQSWVRCEGIVESTSDGTLRLIPKELQNLNSLLSAHGLYMLQSGIELGLIKGKDVIPSHALAMSIERNEEAFPMVEVDREAALSFLRREAIVLPADAPTGYVLVCYKRLPLGFVKNMGNRSNNLYPQEWRIRMQEK